MNLVYITDDTTPDYWAFEVDEDWGVEDLLGHEEADDLYDALESFDQYEVTEYDVDHDDYDQILEVYFGSDSVELWEGVESDGCDECDCDCFEREDKDEDDVVFIIEY